MQNVSSFNTTFILVASVTFPIGVTLTQFADDADPFDFPVVNIADTAKGTNGDLIVWSTANPVPMTLSVIAESQNDTVLSTIYQANFPTRGLIPARDVITLTAYYPSGKIAQALNGSLVSGMPANSSASSGKLKTKTYGFSFESIVST